MIKVKETQGYIIYYDPTFKNFTLYDAEGEVATKNTQQELEDMIDKLRKTKFKPIEVYALTRWGDTVFMEGTVTSVNLDEKSCWWTKKGRTGYGSREKEHFSGSSLYVKTPHNTEVITKLVELNDKIKELQKKDAELRNSLEGRIDLAYFKKDSLQEG